MKPTYYHKVGVKNSFLLKLASRHRATLELIGNCVSVHQMNVGPIVNIKTLISVALKLFFLALYVSPTRRPVLPDCLRLYSEQTPPDISAQTSCVCAADKPRTDTREGNINNEQLTFH